jgi:2-dehydropantoate 2-reductase
MVKSMKVAVYAAGGVGAYFADRLGQASINVSFIARDKHLKKIKMN